MCILCLIWESLVCFSYLHYVFLYRVLSVIVHFCIWYRSKNSTDTNQTSFTAASMLPSTGRFRRKLMFGLDRFNRSLTLPKRAASPWMLGVPKPVLCAQSGSWRFRIKVSNSVLRTTTFTLDTRHEWYFFYQGKIRFIIPNLRCALEWESLVYADVGVDQSGITW